MSRKDGEGVEVSLSQDFVYYKAHNGSDMQGQGQPAGAYIFRPTDDQARVSEPHISEGELEGLRKAVLWIGVGHGHDSHRSGFLCIGSCKSPTALRPLR
jgi:hypothetical protein